MLNSSQIRLLLESCQKRFEANTDRDLRAVVIGATNDDHLDDTRPGRDLADNPEDGPDERGSFPSPASLGTKAILLRKSLSDVYHPNGTKRPRDLIYLGDREALKEYRSIAMVAMEAYLGHRNNLSIPIVSEELSQAFENLEIADTIIEIEAPIRTCGQCF